MHNYKVIDLFAGAGGLSLGFYQTGRFDIKAFVEKNESAGKTYQRNFPNAEAYTDVVNLDFKAINKKYGGIDIVIGGPPCQGFSNANRQHNQAINLNNKLVKQYIRAVLEIQPKVFVMENVSMLRSQVHRFYIEKNDVEDINYYGIPTRLDHIFLLKKEYIFDNIENLVRDPVRIRENLWEPELYHLCNVLYKSATNDIKFIRTIDRHLNKIKKLINQHWDVNEPAIAAADNRLFNFINIQNNDSMKTFKENLKKLLLKPIAFQRMLMWAQEIYENNINVLGYSVYDNNSVEEDFVANVNSCAVYDYLTHILQADQNEYAINKGVLSAEEFGVPQKRKRFILIGVKKKIVGRVNMPKPSANIVRTTVYDAIHDLENINPYETVEEDELYKGVSLESSQKNTRENLYELKDCDEHVYNHIIPKTTKKAMQRFKNIKQGQNFHNLPQNLVTDTYTDPERTQNTIYKRLDYYKPSGTVVNVRKSMWIHPVKDRAISIREAARLQTFPDSFRFYGTKDSEYQQVGNAVPPMLAKAIAEQILKDIDK